MKHKRCDECGNRKPDVREVTDPFAEDVNGEVWLRQLCEPCVQDRADEI